MARTVIKTAEGVKHDVKRISKNTGVNGDRKKIDASRKLGASSKLVLPKAKMGLLQNSFREDVGNIHPEAVSRSSSPSSNQSYTETPVPEPAFKGFASAFSTIMNRDVAGASQPILAERPEVYAEIAKDNRQATTRRQQTAEKNRMLDKIHQPPNVLKKDFERYLKRLATKGVVKLFNAVMTFRKRASGSVLQTTLQGKAKTHAPLRTLKEGKGNRATQGKSEFLSLLQGHDK
eukprot:GHVT01067706.1.p1 GENE.GHVT01067706.1~~GHVT01067706.1.p1  ORF type:complete len:233 (-),score=26.11 GHVT01067706.1:273-971(-)